MSSTSPSSALAIRALGAGERVLAGFVWELVGVGNTNLVTVFTLLAMGGEAVDVGLAVFAVLEGLVVVVEGDVEGVEEGSRYAALPTFASEDEEAALPLLVALPLMVALPLLIQEFPWPLFPFHTRSHEVALSVFGTVEQNRNLSFSRTEKPILFSPPFVITWDRRLAAAALMVNARIWKLTWMTQWMTEKIKKDVVSQEKVILSH
jgi:hypothetical protein